MLGETLGLWDPETVRAAGGECLFFRPSVPGSIFQGSRKLSRESARGCAGSEKRCALCGKVCGRPGPRGRSIAKYAQPGLGPGLLGVPWCVLPWRTPWSPEGPCRAFLCLAEPSRNRARSSIPALYSRLSEVRAPGFPLLPSCDICYFA